MLIFKLVLSGLRKSASEEKEPKLMLIVELTYKKPLEEVEKVLKAHRDFLQTCYDKNLFLASGPTIPRTGGIIVAITDKNTMKTLVQQDPFYIHGIADYKITVFDPVKRNNIIESLLI